MTLEKEDPGLGAQTGANTDFGVPPGAESKGKGNVAQPAFELKSPVDEMAPDTEAAISFLAEFAPQGPWVLTAIYPDRKDIITRTFAPDTLGDMHAWIVDNNNVRNIYFMVNPAIRALAKKATREDVAALAWLHVDIDPEPKEDFAAERKRILVKLQNPPGQVPHPTFIIDSGNGYQGFWRLKAPLPLNGDLERCEDAKRYNQQLEIVFAGDNCHNVDRIMRLPGTKNLPTAQKRLKGRKPAMAKIVEFWPPNAKEPEHHSHRIYSLETFIPALKPTVLGSSKVEVNGNIARLASVEELGDGVKDIVKVVIVQGGDPDNPTRWGSRSEPLYWVVCELIRAGIADEVIYSVITDPEFGISASVLDKKEKAHSYAVRQLEQAHDEAIAPELAKLNKRHAMILNYGGKARVLTESETPVFQSLPDFKERYSNRYISVGQARDGQPNLKPLGDWWIKQPRRREYESVEFRPGEETSAKVFNLWRGWPVTPGGGSCARFLDMVARLICGSDEKLNQWLLDWMAQAIQRPQEPGEVAVVLRGGQGVGKSFFVECFGELFGPHFKPVTDSKHVIGNFNFMLHDALLVFSDEAFAANDKGAEGILKGLVTQSHLTIEPKGVDAFKARKYLRLILASNHSWVVPAGADDRRFLVLDVSKERQRDHAYFGAISEEWNAGGREALMALLQARDISGFNHRNRPETKALGEQKVHSLTGAKKVVTDMLFEGDAPALKVEQGRIFVGVREVMARYSTQCNETALGRELGRAALGHRGCRETCLVGESRRAEQRRGYWLPRLSEARRAWATAVGIDFVWPDDDDDWACAARPDPL